MESKKVGHMYLAKLMMMIWGSYVGGILDTRFEVTRAKLNFAWFDRNMEIDPYDMEMVAPFSFDKDIHDKIGTNECNTVGRSGGDVIKEEKKSSIGKEDREITKTNRGSNDKVGRRARRQRADVGPASLRLATDEEASAADVFAAVAARPAGRTTVGAGSGDAPERDRRAVLRGRAEWRAS